MESLLNLIKEILHPIVARTALLYPLMDHHDWFHLDMNYPQTMCYHLWILISSTLLLWATQCYSLSTRQRNDYWAIVQSLEFRHLCDVDVIYAHLHFDRLGFWLTLLLYFFFDIGYCWIIILIVCLLIIIRDLEFVFLQFELLIHRRLITFHHTPISIHIIGATVLKVFFFNSIITIISMQY